jgi:hypothetical protein
MPAPQEQLPTTDRAADNPFSTCRTRPGAMRFLFPAGQDAETLVGALRRNGWRGEIVGPHGTGKSALLAALVPALERAGQHPLGITLHDGQRRLPPDAERQLQLRWPTLVVVDGYEQLSRWRRFRLRRLCRRRAIGLLVTVHQSVGLPPLYRTAADAELLVAIVAQLLAGEPSPFDRSELSERLARQGGNLREALFELYDLYEQRRSGPLAPRWGQTRD